MQISFTNLALLLSDKFGKQVFVEEWSIEDRNVLQFFWRKLLWYSAL